MMKTDEQHITNDQPKKRQTSAGPAIVPYKCDELMPAEVRTLQDYAAIWREESVSESEKARRLLAYSYIQIILNIGLRSREAQILRWRNLSYKEVPPYKYVFVTVGTGRQTRTAVGGNHTVTAFERIRAMFPAAGPDDFVFRTIEGAPARDLYALQIRSLLVGAGVNISQSGWERLPDCFRHTCAILRLLQNPSSLDGQFGSSTRSIRRRYGYILKQKKTLLAEMKRDAGLSGIDSAKTLSHRYILWRSELHREPRKLREGYGRKKVRGLRSRRRKTKPKSPI